MGFRSVRFYNFRNIEDAEVLLDAPEVFLIGENGQGKTNFIESLYLVSFGSSFRTKREGHLIKMGKETALVETNSGDGRRTSVRVSLDRKKEIRIDSDPVKDRKLLIRYSPCIVFSHGDMEYISGPPDRRRWFFNQTMSLFDALFIDLLRRYRRALRSRNLILRERRFELLDIYDQTLARLGWDIQRMREVEIEDFSIFFSELFGRISGSEVPLTMRYIPSWGRDRALGDVVDIIAGYRDRDTKEGTTTSGPHRDRIEFIKDGQSFCSFASTGQIRLASLALKVAQAEYVERKTGKRPILLLDDVLLELDAEKKRAFLESLPPYEQAVFTFLPNEGFLSYSGKRHSSTEFERES